MVEEYEKKNQEMMEQKWIREEIEEYNGVKGKRKRRKKISKKLIEVK